MAPRTVAIIQARMTSTRLPGKVLKEIFGKPMLARQNEHVARARLVDFVAVATGEDASDDPIAALCAEFGIPSYLRQPRRLARPLSRRACSNLKPASRKNRLRKMARRTVDAPWDAIGLARDNFSPNEGWSLPGPWRNWSSRWMRLRRPPAESLRSRKWERGPPWPRTA